MEFCFVNELFYHILHRDSKCFAHILIPHGAAELSAADEGGQSMNKRNFYVGMGMGLAVGGLAAWTMHPKKRSVKSVAGRTLKTMGEVANAVTELLGLS